MSDEPQTVPTIILAEDDDDDHDLIREAWLEVRPDVAFARVESGPELVDWLHSAAKSGDAPFLVLLDLKMPGGGGFNALEVIKDDAALRRIPVVVLSSSSAERDIYRSYNLGAAGYITKPPTFPKLLEMATAIGNYWVDTVRVASNGLTS